jgi:uncharacterized protein (DUF58 family)
MPTISQPAPHSLWHELQAQARYRLSHIDRPAWRRFALALVGLALSFFLALYSTALKDSGEIELAAGAAGVSLLLAGVVAVKVVPYLARRTALERWMLKVEYEFTREGLVYLVIIIVIATAALNTGNNLLFVILSSLLAALLVSGILSKIVLSQLELDFVLPDHVFASRPMTLRLTLTNSKWFFPSFSLTVSAREPGRKKSGRPSASRLVLEEPVYVPYIPPRSSVTQHVELTFRRRGRYIQEGFRVRTKFPFGLLGKAREVPSRREILVLPDVQPTEEFYEILPLLGGENESFYKGRGHDLYAIRDYQEGDTARHVDWKATAKAQQVKVREFTREDERRVTLAIDARLPAEDEKSLAQFEKGVALCASLAWHFFEIDAQIQFVTDALETSMAPAGEIIYPVLETLALIEPKVESSKPVEAAPDLLSRIASRSLGFNIIVTSQPRGSIPTSLWGTSYLIFINSL